MCLAAAECCGRASARTVRRKRNERGPSFVERERGAARRGAEPERAYLLQNAFSLCRRAALALQVGPPIFSFGLVATNRQTFGLDEKDRISAVASLTSRLCVPAFF